MTRDDRGSIAPLVPVMAMVLLLLGGLVVDASRLLNARGRAVAYAEEAARAGAGAIVPGQARLELQPDAVRARVQAYCDAITDDATQDLGGGVQRCALVPPLGAAGPTDPRLLVVTVAVRVQIPASLLGIVGVRTLTASGQGRARPFEGVDPRDVDSPPPPVELPDLTGPAPAPPGVEVPAFPSPPPLPTPVPTPTPATATATVPPE